VFERQREFLSRILKCAFLACVFAAPVWCQNPLLNITVSDLNDNPVQGLILSTAGSSSTSRPTEAHSGKTSIVLAESTKAGDWVQIVLSQAGRERRYAMIQPFGGWTMVPGFEANSKNFVHVYVIRKDQKLQLNNGRLMVTLVREVVSYRRSEDDNSKTIAAGRSEDDNNKVVPGLDLNRALVLVSEKYGIPPTQLQQAIQAWGERASNDFDKALFALYSQNLEKSTALFTKLMNDSYEKMEIKKLELQNATIRFLEDAIFLGYSLTKQKQYKDAAAVYGKAADVRPDDPWILSSYGRALKDAGDLNGAIRVHKEELELVLSKMKPNHWLAIQARDDLAADYLSAGQYPAAFEILEIQLQQIKSITRFATDEELFASQSTPSRIDGMSLYGIDTFTHILNSEAPNSVNTRDPTEFFVSAVNLPITKSGATLRGVSVQDMWLAKFFREWKDLELWYGSKGFSKEADSLLKREMDFFNQHSDALEGYFAAEALVVSGLVAEYDHNDSDAGNLFLEAITKDHEGGQGPGPASFEASDELVLLYIDSKKYHEADQVAINCLHEINDRHLQIHVREIRSLVDDVLKMYAETEMEKEGEAFLRELSSLAERDGVDIDRAAYMYVAVDFFNAVGNYRQVASILGPVYELEKSEVSDAEPEVTTLLGYAYAMINENDKAEPLLKEEVTSRRQGRTEPLDVTLRRAWYGLALVYYHRRQCTASKDAAHRAAELATGSESSDRNTEKLFASLCEATNFLEQGQDAYNKGKIVDAEKLYRQAIEKDQEDSQDPGRITFEASDSLISLYWYTKHYDQADEVAFNCVREINQKNLSIHLFDMHALVNRAIGFYLATKMDDHGLEFLKQLKLINDRTHDMRGDGYYAAVATDVFESVGRYADVIATLRPHYDWELDHQEKPGAWVLSHLGFAYTMVGNDDKAEPILTEALTAKHDSDPIRNESQMNRSRRGLAIVYFRGSRCKAGQDEMAKLTGNEQDDRDIPTTTEMLQKLSASCQER
jgi:tetratricopeptide (TPR) repeat protein